jgi:hypothetical protein
MAGFPMIKIHTKKIYIYIYINVLM